MLWTLKKYKIKNKWSNLLETEKENYAYSIKNISISFKQCKRNLQLLLVHSDFCINLKKRPLKYIKT